MRPVNILSAILVFACPALVCGQEKPDISSYMTELSRMGAHKAFLSDSPDVYLEPESLGKFFTEPIYKKLTGNAYFGYRFDEGFVCAKREVRIEPIRDLTGKAGAAYRLALEQALIRAGYSVKPEATCHIGVCIIGIEPETTEKTLPGIMAEAYLRNAGKKQSFFIRFGAGSPKGLAAAIRLSAAMLAAELEKHHAKSK